MLEHPNQIDMITKTKSGKLQLVITDAGLTPDPKERLEKLLAKLKTYVGYVVSPEFQKDYPGLSTGDVEILVVCRIPPTDEMRSLVKVTPHGEPDKTIEVFFQVFPGSDRLAENTEKEKNDHSPYGGSSNSPKRLPWAKSLSAHRTGNDIEVPKTAVKESSKESGNFVVHLCFMIALSFILVLKYYLYFVSLVSRTGLTPRLIGSTLAALTMWAFAYGMCLRTGSKILFFGILSAVTLFAGVIVLPLWGWICVIAMYLLYRKMAKVSEVS